MALINTLRRLLFESKAAWIDRMVDKDERLSQKVGEPAAGVRTPPSIGGAGAGRNGASPTATE